MPAIVSVRRLMRKGDFHIVVSASARTLKIFDSDGRNVFQCQARCEGQHRNWRARNGDTPPGLYEAGVIHDVRGAHDEVSYGPWCIDMVDLEGNEDNNGRSGISLHGGGSGLPDPLAPRQGWYPTHGCIRVQNVDLTKTIEPLIRTAQKCGKRVFITVRL